jgi:hypothetical protein
LLILSCVFLALLAAMTVIHVDDRKGLDHVSGAQMALADILLKQGLLYPEWFDGAHIGGTRFFPIPLITHAVLAWVTDDVVAAGKLMNLMAIATVAALITVSALRFAKLPWPLAVGLGCALLASPIGIDLSSTIRYGPEAAALSLGALIAYMAFPGRVGTAVAGSLATLAVFAKPTTAWAALALLIVAVADRRIRDLVVAGATSTIVLSLAFYLWSQGRFLDTVRLLFAGTTDPLYSAMAPFRFSVGLQGAAPAFFLAVVPALIGIRDQRARLFSIAWALATVVALLAYTGEGIQENHLLEMVATTIALSAFGWRAVLDRIPATGEMAMVGALAIVVAMGLLTVIDELNPFRRATHPRDPVAELVPADGYVLFEDPGLAVAREQRPVVLDAFMVARLPGPEGDRARAWLLGELRRRAFDHVVLINDPVEKADWYRDRHFGGAFVGVLLEGYCETGTASSFYVYSPCR